MSEAYKKLTDCLLMKSLVGLGHSPIWVFSLVSKNIKRYIFTKYERTQVCDTLQQHENKSDWSEQCIIHLLSYFPSHTASLFSINCAKRKLNKTEVFQFRNPRLCSFKAKALRSQNLEF